MKIDVPHIDGANANTLNESFSKSRDSNQKGFEPGKPNKQITRLLKFEHRSYKK